MGEKIRDISKVDMKNLSFLIELNDGTVNARKPQYIHLQNDRFRLALSDSEFIQMAVAIRAAGKKIKEYKSFEDGDVSNE